MKGGRMMKSSFQKSNFLYYGIILVSVLLEVIMIWQLESLVPFLYPGFIGFLVFHVLYHFIPSCKTKWALGLLDDMGTFSHVQSSLWLLFRLAFSRFIFWYVMWLSQNTCYLPCLGLAFSEVFFYLNLVKHFSKLVAFSF